MILLYEKASSCESEQRDSNPRPTAPKAAALARLRYAPKYGLEFAKSEGFWGSRFRRIVELRDFFLFLVPKEWVYLCEKSSYFFTPPANMVY